MAAWEEFELGIDHVRNAFRRADAGFTSAYKMLEAERLKNSKLEAENAKLRELVAHLMYVKPRDVSAILYEGKILRFDDLLAEVGMRWESEVD